MIYMVYKICLILLSFQQWVVAKTKWLRSRAEKYIIEAIWDFGSNPIVLVYFYVCKG